MTYEIKIEGDKIYSFIREKWLVLTPEEKVRQTFVCHLINHYGYQLDQMDEELKVSNSHRGQGKARADIVIWKSKEDKQANRNAFIVVECKAENVTIHKEDYYQGCNYARWAGAQFFITSNEKETSFFRVNNEIIPTDLDEIVDIPYAKDVNDEKKIAETLNQLKKFERDEFAKLLQKCHNIIRNNDKLSPEAAFDEISKILFIKIRYERQNNLGIKFSKKEFEKDEQFYETNIKPGITTAELDELAYNYIISRDATPSFKGYEGFPGTICASINEEVVHGIPGKTKLREGDIISVDIGACYKGYHGDSAWTYPVGKISKQKQDLLKHTEESLFAGLSVIKEGARIGDIGYAVSSVANKYHLGVVKELVGHGVGTSVHEAPDVPNYGKQNSGPILKAGMVIAVEPMLNLGTADVYLLDDDWTVITADDEPSAHFEHTVLVTKDGYEILTKR